MKMVGERRSLFRQQRDGEGTRKPRRAEIAAGGRGRHRDRFWLRRVNGRILRKVPISPARRLPLNRPISLQQRRPRCRQTARRLLTVQELRMLDAYLATTCSRGLSIITSWNGDRQGPPSDPNAPHRARRLARHSGNDAAHAVHEFPNGAVTVHRVTRPGFGLIAVDGGNRQLTSFGKLLIDNNFQIYGWFNPGANVSSNKNNFGNAPIAYTVKPNTAKWTRRPLSRSLPRPVQTDHIDWGMRLSVLYGQTTATPILMVSRAGNSTGRMTITDTISDVYGSCGFRRLPRLMIRVGRYISIPDIEAQLAPNNIMYHTRSAIRGTTTQTPGIVTSWQLTKNWMVQVGLVDGPKRRLAQRF